MTTKYRSRVGPKGQIVVAKPLRQKYGIREGGLVEQMSTEKGILITPISPDDLLGELDTVAKEISTTWPKEVSAVDAVREDRDRRN